MPDILHLAPQEQDAEIARWTHEGQGSCDVARERRTEEPALTRVMRACPAAARGLLDWQGGFFIKPEKPLRSTPVIGARISGCLSVLDQWTDGNPRAVAVPSKVVKWSLARRRAAHLDAARRSRLSMGRVADRAGAVQMRGSSEEIQHVRFEDPTA